MDKELFMKHLKLNLKIPNDVHKIFKIFEAKGYEAFVVGGCVRDALLDKEPKDWDICTNAEIEAVKKIFSDAYYKVIPTGIKHGTVTLMRHYGNGIFSEGYEVTTYRVDGKYSDGRHPDEVIFTSSLEEDLARRDFTINAMAYNPRSGLIDPFGGEEDLKRKIIRCVGNPVERFSEDYLRMLRAVRFSAVLDFKIEQKTEAAIIMIAPYIVNVSIERIQSELNKILLNPVGLLDLRYTRLFEFILPEITTTYGYDQRNPHHNYDLFYHTLHTVIYAPDVLHLKLAALLHDFGKPFTQTFDDLKVAHYYGHPVKSTDIARNILTRLRYDNDTVDVVTKLIYFHDWRCDIGNKRTLRKMISELGKELVSDLIALKWADRNAHSTHNEEKYNEWMAWFEEASAEIIEQGDAMSVKDLAIKGKHIIDMGVAPGKVIGEVLQSCLAYVMEDPERNQEDILLSYAKSLLF